MRRDPINFNAVHPDCIKATVNGVKGNLYELGIKVWRHPQDAHKSETPIIYGEMFWSVENDGRWILREDLLNHKASSLSNRLQHDIRHEIFKAIREDIIDHHKKA